jgi:hypothetical protein
MAVRLNDLRARIRQRANEEASGAVSAVGWAELTTLANASYRELYDLLVAVSEDYFTTSASVAITSGNTVALTSLASFYKMRGVEKLRDSNGRYATCTPYQFENRNDFQPGFDMNPWGVPIPRYRIVGGSVRFEPEAYAAGTYRFWYVPQVAVMAPDANTIGGVYYECVKEGTATGAVTVAYTGGGTAGSEVVTVTGNAISVQIESGVSTPTQVANAVNDSATARLVVYAEARATAAVTTVGATALAGQVDMSTTIIEGMEEYIVVDAAIKVLQKLDKDPAALMASLAAIKQRIMNMAKDRDAGPPDVVADVRGHGLW